jgi:ADP-ribose pyrophosphatase YjhB (NUDIX family)
MQHTDGYAVRAVIIDEDLNTPILNVKNGEYYKIPGGTIEEGEDVERALEREIREEAGCKIEVIKKIGTHQFDVGEKNKTYHSTCYLAKLIGEKNEAEFDEWEKSRNFVLVWMNIDKAIDLFENTHPRDLYEIIIHGRDLNFLKIAREEIKKGI